MKHIFFLSYARQGLGLRPGCDGDAGSAGQKTLACSSGHVYIYALMTAIDDELSQQQVMVSTYALHSHAAGSGA